MSFNAPPLQVEQVPSGLDLLVNFSGFLDETSELPKLSADIKGQLRINLESLVGINSLGCRKWTLWIKENTHVGRGAVLLNCGPAVINQINVLSGFVPKHVRVESLYAPYACTRCKATAKVLLKFGTDFNDQGLIQLAENRPCPICQAPMELDVVRERYFKFVRRDL